MTEHLARILLILFLAVSCGFLVVDVVFSRNAWSLIVGIVAVGFNALNYDRFVRRYGR